MATKSNPLNVLLDIKVKLGVDIEDDLIKKCYQLQSDHQYDKDRDTMKKMQELIEESISETQGDELS